MKIGEKIQRICDREGLKLKEFSELAGISYSAAKYYVRGDRAPTVAQLQKITQVERFKKYSLFITSPDADEKELELIDKQNITENDPTTETDEFNDLFRQVCEAGHGDEALKYLRYLAKREDSE
ncbi:conserved hypothetical protein [Teredinibacter turnerae T7901]|uniref:HTH cro/C1-type domain-containing protein n=1 Tax=Teredinibacter turnerae (strain ATCC 39867 / T7901) TaxID=377629 RepID=C5BSM8_TERTT|nr:helix-turn-helix domain-containing protein [Teredinibacter turnerae]ACR13213.1 conserved hypothetical protein [Teredinibacter turnerae T7901]